MNKRKVIYDFGSNNGDDLPYYLKKADLVVAVEANPLLCEQIRTRFPDELSAGRLVLEDKVLATSGAPEEVEFYVHKTNHVLSQFPEPDDLDAFRRVVLPSCSPLNLIDRYGEPFYIKVDIEHYDVQILRELFTGGVQPPFISAEAHTAEVFAVLIAMGHYKSFKIVEGHSVSKVYNGVTILGPEGHERYDFPNHSAGPFGDDVLGSWLDSFDMMRVLVAEGFGWKDIHATNCREPDAFAFNNWWVASRLISRSAKRRLKRYLR